MQYIVNESYQIPPTPSNLKQYLHYLSYPYIQVSSGLMSEKSCCRYEHIVATLSSKKLKAVQLVSTIIQPSGTLTEKTYLRNMASCLLRDHPCPLQSSSSRCKEQPDRESIRRTRSHSRDPCIPPRKWLHG
jgi:hypothetical protein